MTDVEDREAMRRASNDRDAERRRKLPVWAQDEIARLRLALASAESKLAAGPKSNTVLDPYSRAPRPLGDNPIVRHSHGRAEIEVRFTDGVVQVTVMGSMDGQLAVMPMVSNVVHITSVPRP